MLYSNALAGVGLIVPGYWWYSATTPNNFIASGGTSLAAPQLSASGMIIKQSFLANGLTYIDSPGVLYTALLAMGDRGYGGWTYKSSGFDGGYGAGRLQLRYFMSGSDHPAGGAWGFDQWEVMVFNGNTIDFPIRGTGAEPATIQQFKVYAVVFEDNWDSIADVDISVRDKNCGADSVQLGADTSRDTKSMVRLGAVAAGKQLCVRVRGYAVPPAGRRVVIASYLSVDTQMR